MDPSLINQTAPYLSTALLAYFGNEQLNYILGPSSQYIGEQLLTNIKKIRVERYIHDSAIHIVIAVCEDHIKIVTVYHPDDRWTHHKIRRQ